MSQLTYSIRKPHGSSRILSNSITYFIDGKILCYMQLANIKYHPDMSDETLAFTATLIIGTPVSDNAPLHNHLFRCKNDGRGGQTDIDSADPKYFKECRALIQQLDNTLGNFRDESFYEIAQQLGHDVSALPEVTLSVESIVNSLLEDWLASHT